ncbi:hypothetical protein C5615_04960 [Burkholderia cepacia]|uniref:Acyl carrier protein n=1 Tax=Burkholderia cepacia TaxID=292 RepID=A0A2S8J1U9_BURCE|nr:MULTISPECIES: DUF1493 family protein [Burkholderia]EKS9884328.1 DUF1493 family protein [Burkholderia pyrrocinia]EKS9891957.1 DUF1493 family protein [Burkholderia pyrrocinia]EKS9908768.1 DUF1493 family protein [Burkholderia pyrrocinia]PQP21034.1 hypothetical protein C5615_04960 [Burkholderia cepacia]UOB58986.1 DUF1493 family protein [Burkholderia pyrrocinia]
MADAWKSLEAFITADVGRLPVDRTELTRDTDLYHDLDLEPGDIDELVRQWAVTFGVDLSAFDIHYYYPSAKLGIGSFLAAVVKSPFSNKARETLGGRSLTLGMMEEAMERGRWEP